MPTTTEKLIARKEGGIGWIIFNNPAKRNAMSMDMYEAMTAALEDYSRDPAVRVVILKGAGDKAFVSGADISEFKEKRSTAESTEIYHAASERAAKTLRDCPKPTIAMIRGFCMGGGMGTAVNCDLRIASDDSRFGVPAAKLGVGYRYERLKHLEALVGPSFTMEIFYTGRQFTAQEALTMGLINRMLPVDELEPYVLNYANTIVNNAPLTIAAVKTSVMQMGKAESQRDIALCDRMVDACFASKDYIEGRDAFLEKRKAAFQGR
ncbi:MAG: Enoyl-CoA hydratase [Betaproteobacteria bacterium]|nr:Enoyl-CoA hydratase [Betaproteobacteria bacterium]